MLTNLKDNIVSQLVKNEPDLVSLLKVGDLVEGQVLKKNQKVCFWIWGNTAPE